MCPRVDGGAGVVVAVLLSIAGAAGCPVGPDFVRPAAPSTLQYASDAPAETKRADDVKQRFRPSDALAARWWRAFRSESLSALVDEAVTRNPSGLAARASLAASEHALDAGAGVFLPSLSFGAGVDNQQFSPLRFGSSAAPPQFTLLTVSTTVSYALDVWGGQVRQTEALRDEALAQRYALFATYLMLESNVANTAIASAGYQAQIDATVELVDVEAEQVKIGEARARAGTAPFANVATLESQLAATRATLPPLRQRLQAARHLLATLLGRTPAEDVPTIALSDFVLPQDLPVSLPASLVRQRPDVLQAEAELGANNARVGVATAAMLPSLTLTGNAGTNATKLSQLFSPQSFFWSVGESLAQPFLDEVTLMDRLQQANDVKEQSLDAYQNRVLSALAQVADALTALDNDAALVDAEDEAARSATTSLKLAQASFEAGTTDYLSLLVANAQLLQARLGLIQARTQRLQDTVALFAALGGGWWNDATYANELQQLPPPRNR